MFDDLKEKIETFYKLTKKEHDIFLKEINIRINKEPEKFKEFMSNIGYGYETNRAMFYEALISYSPQSWSDYIFAELNKLIDEAENGNENAINELDSIFWLAHVPQMEKDFYKKTKTYLFTKLKSNIAQVREHSLAGIFDILDLLGDKPNEHEKVQLRDCLNDTNFINKLYAYDELKEANLLPENFKFSLIEKIRRRLRGFI